MNKPTIQTLYSIILKKGIRHLIARIGKGCYELILDIKIDDIIYTNIEYNQEEDKIYLHYFDEDLEYTLDFDILNQSEKFKIYQTVKKYTN